jgi:putative NADH-flavin reductase
VKLLVFGATGGTGREIVRQALEQGHDVTGFARNASALAHSHDRLRVVQGDMLDVASVEAAVPGHDAVLSALGSPSLRSNSALSDGTRNIVRAMDREGVWRLVVISSMGVGDSKSQLGLFYNVFLIPVFLRNVFVDKETQEQYVRDSPLEWTIVRPGTLTNGPRTGVYRIGFGTSEVPPFPKISRADVADFMLKELAAKTHLKTTPGIFY